MTFYGAARQSDPAHRSYQHGRPQLGRPSDVDATIRRSHAAEMFTIAEQTGSPPPRASFLLKRSLTSPCRSLVGPGSSVAGPPARHSCQVCHVTSARPTSARWYERCSQRRSPSQVRMSMATVRGVSCVAPPAASPHRHHSQIAHSLGFAACRRREPGCLDVFTENAERR